MLAVLGLPVIFLVAISRCWGFYTIEHALFTMQRVYFQQFLG